MRTNKLQLTVFGESSTGAVPSLEQYSLAFHNWIRQGALPETLIDVVGYGHIADGPGVLLVGHQADYVLSNQGQRVALCCRLKRGTPASDEPLYDAMDRLLLALSGVELDENISPKIQFDVSQILVQFNDRLRTPNTANTFERWLPALQAFFAATYNTSNFSLRQVGEPRERFAVRFALLDAAAVATRPRARGTIRAAASAR